MSDLEQALMVRCGTGKRAFEMTEELAFEKALGNGPAVDGDELFGRARASDMDGACCELFTRCRSLR